MNFVVNQNSENFANKILNPDFLDKPIVDFKTSRYFVSYMSSNPDFNDTIKRSFGAELEDMLVECTFNLIRCNLSDFEWFYDTYYGSCFRFNSNKTKQLSKKGKHDGLDMKLYIPKPYGKKNTLSERKGVFYFKKIFR